jgi:DNA polymerase-4
MDAFYAAVEQLDRPELRGRAVIVGAAERRGVVATASYEARAFGVHSAMPGVEARRRCPDGVFLPPRMERYVEMSAIVRGVFERYTERIEPLSLDEAFLDVTGSRMAFGDGRRIAERIRREVREETGGLTVSVGVAASKFVAKVASDLRKPDGLVVVPAGTEKAFLAPLPVTRVWGVGKVGAEALARAGITTIGDLQSIEERVLVGFVGGSAARQWIALANGDDDRPVETGREPKSIGHERTFREDLTSADACESVLLGLAEDVGRRLREAGLRARAVQLKLRLSPFDTSTRRRRFPTPTDADLEIGAAARSLFRATWRSGRGVRLLGVTATDLVAASVGRQGMLFGTAAETPGSASLGTSRTSGGRRDERLDRALDALRARYGRDAVRRAGADPGPGSGGAWGPPAVD